MKFSLNPSSICSKSNKRQTSSQIWVVDQDQLNPYVAYEGYVVRVPHNPLMKLRPKSLAQSSNRKFQNILLPIAAVIPARGQFCKQLSAQARCILCHTCSI